MGWERRPVGAIIALAALLVSGCATVRSHPRSDYQLGRSSAGLTYFLPMRMIKATASRVPVKLEELNKKLAQAETQLGAAKTAFEAAKQKREQAALVLAALEAGAPNRPALEGALAAAKAEEKVAEKAFNDLTLSVRDLREAVALAGITGTVCSYSAKLELMPPQADPDRRFVANLAHSPLRDDTMTLKVTTAGLLSSANVVAADRTGDIIVELAGAFAGMGVPRGRTLVQAPQDDCVSRPKQFVHIFDPLAGWNASAPANLPAINGLNALLLQSGFPLRIQMDTAALVARSGENSAARLGGKPEYRRYEGALYYRTPVPLTASIEQVATVNGQSVWQPIDAAIVMLPQAGPVSYIPMNSSAFVKTVDDVQFADGSISSWSAERPSEVLEVVRLPVRILTAIVSVPAQLLSLRVDYSSKAKSLAENQRLEMQMAEKLAQTKLCVELAEAAGESTAHCF